MDSDNEMSPPDSPVLAPQSSRTPSSLPWIEKYRPRKLDEVAHQDEVVHTLRRTLQSGNVRQEEETRDTRRQAARSQRGTC